eukprot:s1615_g3.t2
MRELNRSPHVHKRQRGHCLPDLSRASLHDDLFCSLSSQTHFLGCHGSKSNCRNDAWYQRLQTHVCRHRLDHVSSSVCHCMGCLARDSSHTTQKKSASSVPMDKEAGAALLLTATSLDECKDLFQQQACATHPTAGGTLQELLSLNDIDDIGDIDHVMYPMFNMILNTFSSLCNGFAMAGKLQWLPDAESSVTDLTDLQALLRRLSPLRRREAIQRLPLQERQRLEKWMLRKSSDATVEKTDTPRLPRLPRRGTLSERSLCSQARKVGSESFRPCVHLHEGLYVQALSCRDLPMAVAALGTLIIMRSLCRTQTHDQIDQIDQIDQCAHRKMCRKTCYDFVRQRALDLQRAIATTLSVHTLNDKLSFVFRTRFALSKSCELATPSRREPQAAIEDWVVMIWAMDALDKSFKKPTHTELSLLTRDRKRKPKHPKLFPSEVRPGRLKLLKFVSAISTMPGAVRGKMDDLGSHGVSSFEDTEPGGIPPHCEKLDCLLIRYVVLLISLWSRVAGDEDVCHGSCDFEPALVALQRAARKVRNSEDRRDSWPTKLDLKKLPRLQSRREPRAATSGLTGSAWSDFAVEVMVGTESFPVIVDTGSSTFAIPARPVAGCAFYTGDCEGRPIEARYGSANWTGRVCYGPEVEMGGLPAGHISFAGIYEQNNFLTECTSIPGGFVSRGIIGMAYPALLPQGLSQSLWDSVVATTQIRNVFAMQCCPWSGLNRGTGSLTLGGWDQQLYDEEDFVYTPITMEKWFCVRVEKVFLVGFEDMEDSEDSEDLGAAPKACSEEAVGSCILSDCQDPSSTCDMDSLTCRCKAGHCNYFGQCLPEHSQASKPSLSQQRSDRANIPPFGFNESNATKAAWSFNDIINWFKNIFGGKSLSKRCTGIVDTGTSSLILPEDVFKKVLKDLNEVATSWQLRNSCLSQFEVDLFPDLIVRLDSANSSQPVDLRIPPSTYFQLDPGAACRTLYIRSSGALNKGLGEIPDFILGQPLLEAYYTVFDKEQQKIGFAPLKGC